VGDAVVIGIGSADRGDDAVGIAVVDALARRDLAGVDLVVGDGDPGWLIDVLEGRSCAVVVDAMRTGDHPPGTVVVLDASASGLPEPVRLASSHAMGAAASLELARTLGRLPERVVVVGVEAESMGLGDAMTAGVVGAVGRAVDAVMEVLGDA